ncbi:unsaturated chondroitin disaccharide hydrolase [Olivibacter domesticus]|uniref:Unsaturated chondroitin disaccharide hydrolase n=2 Tax=Olivibacter domesticus TaxID=407022 RepID=A0A1H7GE70_OLID1|nr:unsaturated chondroitin disaccharide hydrolase [Olivibacter domesticus]
MRILCCYLVFFSLNLMACHQKEAVYDPQKDIEYCIAQAKKTLMSLPIDTPNIPRNITDASGKWKLVNYKDWTSGFWPGILWYAYQASGDDSLKYAADRCSRELIPLSQEPAIDHDLGFQVFSSFGNGYRLTKDTSYKQIILASADTLATLFNPHVGTILSWPRAVPNMEWPQHNTIIDNMINLELLFWASKNGGDSRLYDIAVSHAEKTMKNHFRPDYTAYHAVVYDRETGEKIKGITHQGYSDGSMWARGQAWAIYGYTMCYRETGKQEFLDFAEKVAKVYLDRLPDDLVPYWDFDDPAVPNAPRDASAAAVTASALLELSGLVNNQGKAAFYYRKAADMLASLSTSYQSGEANTAFLKHVTGHKPNNSEVDASINYADYYYLEALLRLKNSTVE